MGTEKKTDEEILYKTTEDMIDATFTEFAKFLEGKNIGELKAFRGLLQVQVDRADLYAKRLVEDTVSTFNKEQRVQMGSIFAIITKIVDRMGYIDYLIQKNSIQ